MNETFDVDHYLVFIEKCQKRNIKIKVKRGRYLEMREEFLLKLNWHKEIQKCIDWLYDNEKEVISLSRIRNWMRKSLEFAKQNEMKQMQKYSDKNNFVAKPQKPYKMEPLWEPPT